MIGLTDCLNNFCVTKRICNNRKSCSCFRSSQFRSDGNCCKSFFLYRLSVYARKWQKSKEEEKSDQKTLKNSFFSSSECLIDCLNAWMNGFFLPENRNTMGKRARRRSKNWYILFSSVYYQNQVYLWYEYSIIAHY